MNRAELIASNPELADRWAQEQAITAKLTDGLRRSLDPGVVDTVTALRLAGCETQQSCWGHWHRAVPGPWVHVVPDEGETFESVDARVRGLLADFNASRRVAPHRHLSARPLHHHEPPHQPCLVRIEGQATTEMHHGERPRDQRELRAARRTMAAFTDYLIRRYVES